MENEEPWQFVRIDEYKVPESSVDRVKKSVLTILGNLIGGASDSRKESPLDPKQDLLSLTEDQLERARPRPDWVAAGELLQEELRPWLEATHPTKPVLFYVAPPFSGREEILRSWASTQNALVVEEPSKEQILSDHAGWFNSWPEAELWLLPRLEKCFLRSAEGVDLVREFLARVLAGDMGMGVIGCDSWAWSFLQRVWLGRPSFTITAQAFDPSRMKHHFARGVGGQVESGPTFRQSDTGDYLLGKTEDEEDPEVVQPFWRKLAVYARGNIGVAAAYWERTLRTLPEKELQERDVVEEQPGEETIWVTPWEDLDRPALSPEAGETARFVLHALLLHGGLDLRHITSMLPADRAGITEALLFLAESELVEESDGQWRVTAWGYPAVRSALSSNEYLCDSF